MDQKQKLYQIHIQSGPIFDLNDGTKFRRDALAEISDGQLLTYGLLKAVDSHPSFPLRVLTVGDDGLTDRLRFLLFAVGLGAAAAWKSALRGKHVVVVSYDPFLSGIIAAIIAVTSPARFLCEINGVFGNDDNYADLAPHQREAKKTKMLGIMRAVLRFASGLRLLYPTQLENTAVSTKGKSVDVLFDPVDLDRFNPSQKEKTIIMVGHPFKRKGVDVLLAAFSKVREQAEDWKLVLIGHEITEILADCGGPPPGVEVHRPIRNVALAAHLSSAAIACMPSRSEAMGRIMLEAAAAGCARIASRVDGVPRIIEDGVDGLLFEKEDVHELTDALLALIKNDQFRERIASAGRRQVQSRFAKGNFVEGYRTILESVSRVQRG